MAGVAQGEIGDDDLVRLCDAPKLFLGDYPDEKTLLREHRNGHLPIYKIGGLRLTTRNDIEEWKVRRRQWNGVSNGYVYFIQCGDFVKIGVAEKDIPRRVRSLQSANPLPLTLLASCAGGYRREAELHRLFAAHRHRDEWFRLTPEIQAYIDELSNGA